MDCKMVKPEIDKCASNPMHLTQNNIAQCNMFTDTFLRYLRCTFARYKNAKFIHRAIKLNVNKLKLKTALSAA